MLARKVFHLEQAVVGLGVTPTVKKAWYSRGTGRDTVSVCVAHVVVALTRYTRMYTAVGQAVARVAYALDPGVAAVSENDQAVSPVDDPPEPQESALEQEVSTSKRTDGPALRAICGVPVPRWAMSGLSGKRT
jgi:hypothetical protein